MDNSVTETQRRGQSKNESKSFSLRRYEMQRRTNKKLGVGEIAHIK